MDREEVELQSCEPLVGRRDDDDISPHRPLIDDYKQPSSRVRKDFGTLDWYFQKYVQKRNRQLVSQQNGKRGFRGHLKNALMDMESVLVLLVVGVCTAMSGLAIGLCSQWLIQLKQGYCHLHGFWTPRNICCLDAPNGLCSAWTSWHAFLGLSPGFVAFCVDFVSYVGVAIGAASLSAWLCMTYAHNAAGSGIPEVKTLLGGVTIARMFTWRVLLVKLLALPLSVGAGIGVGKEGPLVHLACCWAYSVSGLLNKYTDEVKRRELISAAAAAGVASAFASPLGGVLFSLECVSSFFPPTTMWRAFWCASMATLSLMYLDPFGLGVEKLVQVQIQYHHQWNWFELPIFALIGCLGGLIGACFLRMHNAWSRKRRTDPWLIKHPVKEVAILALVASALNVSNVFTRNSSLSLLDNLFGDCKAYRDYPSSDLGSTDYAMQRELCSGKDMGLSIVLLLVAMAIKMLSTVFAYGAHIPGGIFIPSFAIGALLGRACGMVVLAWYQSVGDTMMFTVCAGRTQCVYPSVYAVVGASSVLCGVTRLTVSLVVIMVEMTGGLEYVGPVMMAVVCAKWVADLFGKEGIFNLVIALYGFPHLDNTTEVGENSRCRMSDVMVADPICLTVYGMTVSSLRSVLHMHPYHGFPIIQDERERLLYGFISRDKLELELSNLASQFPEHTLIHRRIHFSEQPPPFPTNAEVSCFTDWVDRDPIRVLPTTPLDRVLELFKGLGLRYCLVCNSRGRLEGLIKKKNLLIGLLAQSRT